MLYPPKIHPPLRKKKTENSVTATFSANQAGLKSSMLTSSEKVDPRRSQNPRVIFAFHSPSEIHRVSFDLFTEQRTRAQETLGSTKPANTLPNNVIIIHIAASISRYSRRIFRPIELEMIYSARRYCITQKHDGRWRLSRKTSKILHSTSSIHLLRGFSPAGNFWRGELVAFHFFNEQLDVISIAKFPA